MKQGAEGYTAYMSYGRTRYWVRAIVIIAAVALVVGLAYALFAYAYGAESFTTGKFTGLTSPAFATTTGCQTSTSPTENFTTGKFARFTTSVLATTTFQGFGTRTFGTEETSFTEIA